MKLTLGVLAIHGFSGGPYELEPFTDYIVAHTECIVDKVTLSGHGEHLDLIGRKYTDWLMDAELAIRRLQKRVDEVIVVGFSMGGLIAMYLAKRYKVKKLVLLSAAEKYVSPVQLTRDLHVVVNDALHGLLKENSMYQMYKPKLRNVPLQAVVEFLKCVRTVEPYIAHLKMPVFIVQGQLDEIVPSSSAQYLYNKIGSMQKYVYMSESGKHMICYSEDRELWFEQVVDFMISK